MLPNTATDNLKFKDDYPMENKDQKFDKKEYDKQYRKENFKQIAFRYRSDDIDYIKDFAKQRGLSIPQREYQKKWLGMEKKALFVNRV